MSSAIRFASTKCVAYAIALLALRLGLRVGDIVELRIEDIDFQHKKICFVQTKTKVKQSLELLPEVEDALIDYLENVRPASNLKNVFLSPYSPDQPIRDRSIYAMVRRHLVKSGVDPGERKRGPHALRMTLASELVAEKVPYDVVRKILGHENPISTKNYVAFDIESLRTCAIPVPPLSGSLAMLMAGEMKGLPL